MTRRAAMRLTLAPLGAVTLAGLVWLAGACRGTMALPTPSVPPDASAEAGSGTAGEVQRIVRPLLDEYPGLSVAVITGDGGLWSAGFGTADLETARPVSTRTRFRMYSLAKPITATAAVALAEAGQLELDAPAARYLPELPAHLGAVTPRQLIGHLSGVRHYRGGEWLEVSRAPCGSPLQALAAFIDDSLTSSPGTTYLYSSYGYVLLSAIIEAAAQEPFGTVLSRTVLGPAGMIDTNIESADDTSDLATFYEPAILGRVREARRLDNSCKWGSGALVSSAEDVARFGHALLTGALVSADGRAMMLTSMTIAPSGDSTGYGFGFGIGEDEQGRRYAAHSGGAIGGRAAIYLYPDEGISVGIAGNVEGAPLTGAAGRIARLFGGTTR